MKLSIICPIKKPIITYNVFGIITELKSDPIKLLIVKSIINIAPTIGPRYGIKFNNAQRKAMINAFSTLNNAKTMLYITRRILICNNNPKKYLESRFLVFSIDFSTRSVILSFTNARMILF